MCAHCSRPDLNATLSIKNLIAVTVMETTLFMSYKCLSIADSVDHKRFFARCRFELFLRFVSFSGIALCLNPVLSGSSAVFFGSGFCPGLAFDNLTLTTLSTSFTNVSNFETKPTIDQFKIVLKQPAFFCEFKKCDVLIRDRLVRTGDS